MVNNLLAVATILIYSCLQLCVSESVVYDNRDNCCLSAVDLCANAEPYYQKVVEPSWRLLHCCV
jgi:hypothetical protein